MPNPALLPTFLRELFVTRSLEREPEHEPVMDDPERIAAYAETGRVDGIMAAVYLFHSAHISQVVYGCESVLDLACGPATQLAQVAELNPNIQFTGIDLSPNMLRNAQVHIKNLDLNNVDLRLGDITQLDNIDDHSFDAVISTMSLHHLPTLQHLDALFATIRRVLKPGGALYLTDFGRLKSLKSVIFFAYMNAKYQSYLFSLDFERSMRAAFLKEELASLAAKYFPSGIEVVSTFSMPFLVIIKTADQPLPQPLLQKLIATRHALTKRYRRDLKDLCAFFAFGGLRNDPFASRMAKHTSEV